MKNGGEKNGDIRNVIEKMNQIKLMSTSPNMHSVKAMLDELNFLVHKAKGVLGDKVNTNEDIQNFLRHIYPGKSIELYKAIFGDPKMALIRKLYAENVKCVDESKQTALSIIKDYDKSIDLDTQGVVRPVTPEKPTPGSVTPPAEDEIK